MLGAYVLIRAGSLRGRKEHKNSERRANNGD
jgi:hypothetical protein